MKTLLFRYRLVLGFFIVGLLLSGITAFPLLHELRLLGAWMGIQDHANLAGHSGLAWWIGHVWHGLEVTDQAFPFIAYGTDWLAFGHIMIAFFFIGPWRDPIANAWVLRTGLVCCAAVFPLALICGEIRGIPLYWRFIDCSFGLFGALPLLYCLKLVREMLLARDPRINRFSKRMSDWAVHVGASMIHRGNGPPVHEVELGERDSG